jgi:hypothetical protein
LTALKSCHYVISMCNHLSLPLYLWPYPPSLNHLSTPLSGTISSLLDTYLVYASLILHIIAEGHFTVLLEWSILSSCYHMDQTPVMHFTMLQLHGGADKPWWG